MRLSRLHLERFGHFDDLVLELPADKPRLHLIYGSNEAGKSTTLRAIRGFFFGIPDQSGDTHTHGGDLRVGVDLLVDGELHRFTRRKGRKNTLLDAAGVAVDEHGLTRLLGGVTESMFERLFGLDHEGLRAGAEALLVDGGQVGESLYEAGIAGRGVRALLLALREEAGALFRARGKKPLLNEALEAFAQAQRRCQEDALSVEVYREEEQQLIQAERDRDALKEKRSDLGLQLARLQRLVAVLPLLQRLAECERRLHALGDVPRLSQGATAAREEAQSVLLQAEPEIEQRQRIAEGLRGRLSALRIPEGLLDLDVDVVAILRDRLGSHRKAETDLPRRREAVRVAQAEARGLLRRLGLPQKVVDVDAPEIVTADRARVRRLTRDYSGYTNAVTQSERQHAERAAELVACEQKRAELSGEERNASELRQALAQAKEAAASGNYLQEQEAELSALAGQLAASAAALSPFLTAELEGACHAPPLLETAEGFSARHAALRATAETLAEEHDALNRARVKVAQELDALQRAGSVPTEEDLARIRHIRDGLLARVQASPGDDALLDTLRGAIADSDALADRLRREVDRTTRLAHHLAEDSALRQQLGTLTVRSAEHAAAEAEEEKAFEGFCERHGLRALSPDEVCGVVQRLLAHAGLQQRVLSCQARSAPLLAAQASALSHLRAVLGKPADGAQGSLPALIAELEGVVTLEDQRRAEATTLLREHERLSGQVARLAQQHASDCAALDAWQADWQDAMKGLPLRADATVDEAQAVLDDLSTLAAKLEEVQKLRRRIKAMEEDAEAFAQDVFRLRDRHLYQLGESSVEDAAMELVAAHDAARRDAVERERLTRELEAQEAAIASLSLRSEQARRSLQELCATARVQQPGQLSAAEQRSAEATRLDVEREQAAAQLLSAADGLSLDEVRAEAQQVRIDEARAQRDEVSAALSDLDQEIEESVRKITAHAAALSRLRDKEGASAAAVELSEQEERVRRYVQRYVRLRLSEKMLEREILRYRERHQGPLLARASELFAKLTCGRYTGIEVAYDDADRAVLRCMRAVGGSAPVDGLSDGSRDPLFLALRLATLEGQSGPPLPLVLDDILIHADDGRARAALAVLGEVSAMRQVLFFTHHEHLRDLAREAVAADALSEHCLPAPAMPRGLPTMSEVRL